MKETRRRGKPSIPGSSLQTNSVHCIAQGNRIAEGAEPRMWNLVFSNQHGGSILIEALERMDRTQALSTTTKVGQHRIGTHRRRLQSEDAMRGEIAWARPNSKLVIRVTWDDTERKVIEGNT